MNLYTHRALKGVRAGHAAVPQWETHGEVQSPVNETHTYSALITNLHQS